MSTVTDAEVEALEAVLDEPMSLYASKRHKLRAGLEAAEAVRVKTESNLQKVQIPTSTLPEGFIPWHGGERPVAEGTECQLVFGDGFVTTPMPIHKRFFTKGFEPRTTVVAYRIHKPADFRLEAGKFYVTANGERVGTLWLAHEKDIIGRLRYTNGRDEWAFDGTCVYDPRLNILALSSNQENRHE